MHIFWDIPLINDSLGLGQFLVEIQTKPNSNFLDFYLVIGLFWDYFIKGCPVKKTVLSDTLHLLCVRKDSNMLFEQTMLFSLIELKLFFWAFMTSWTMKWQITYMSVFVYLCHCVILWSFVCVTLVVSSFLYRNIFQSAPNWVQIFLNAIPRDGLL